MLPIHKETFTYSNQFVSVIIAYRVARANIKWNKDQLYATSSSSLSHTR